MTTKNTTTKTKQRYQLSADDIELAEMIESYARSRVYLEPTQMIQEGARQDYQLFFRVIGPKYGFDPSTAGFAGDVHEPSWDVLAVPK